MKLSSTPGSPVLVGPRSARTRELIFRAPLGLIHAIGEYARPRGALSGLAVIKQRLLRALQGAGVALHEIQPAPVIYPKDGPLCAYVYHSDPVVPVYWLTDKIGPSVERAIVRYRGASE